MYKTTSPNIVNFTPSTPAPDLVGSGQAATPQPVAPPEPGDAESTAGSGGSTRGRKSGYSERVIDMMCGPIREHGLSDSAAAESVGMSSSTISRWKQQYPELGPQLQQAREQARLHHLRLINQAAEAENGKGWRASAWMLERLFPGDYSPRMQERALWREFEEYRREREEQQFRSEQIAERARQYNASVAQAKRAAAAAEAEAAKCAAASESASHNSRNAAAAQTRQTAAAAEAQAAPCAAASEAGSHNSRNTAAAGPQREPQTLREVLSSVERNSVEGPSAPAEHLASTFKHDSHNSQNSAAATDIWPAVASCPASEPQVLSPVEGTASHNSRNSAPRPVLSGPTIPGTPIFSA